MMVMSNLCLWSLRWCFGIQELMSVRQLLSAERVVVVVVAAAVALEEMYISVTVDERATMRDKH